MTRRTLLFMPGDNPGMIISSSVLGADMVCFDLEDAVSQDEKDSARILVRNALKSLDFRLTQVGVRINPLDSPFWEEDLIEIIPKKPRAIIIPKANLESVKIIERRVDEILGQDPYRPEIYLLIESPDSLLDLKNICQSSKYKKGLILGGEDYAASMGIERTETYKELEYARFVLGTTAHGLGLEAIDTPYTNIRNLKGLVEDTSFSKSIGLTGRLLISPEHVQIVNEIFSPKQEEIEEAREIIRLTEEAQASGIGCFSFQGKMVDAPVIKRARQVMENAEKWGLV